ncbi:MAG TPA: methyltransferase domain-containing protein [Solidesulfovibrio magneticus]|nr:methyltransferase domain-containing protein [Solidesulfovibrio magneticus]
MTKQSNYGCPYPECRKAPLVQEAHGLLCPNEHRFPYAPGTNIPIFAKAPEDSSEYSIQNAATVHDNSLRWLFATFGEDENALRERLASRLRLQPGQKLLVTGVGAGNDLPFLARTLQGAGEIYALDIAQPMLLAAAERHGAALRRDGVGVEFSVGDATELPFPDNFFDAAFHFGGINLFPDIRRGVAEMARVVRTGGRVVFGDEGVAPWLRETVYGKMLVQNNPLYACDVPLSSLPESAREVQVSWELGNCFYVIDFTVGQGPFQIDIDVPHVGLRGGSIRSRYFGQLEGVAPDLRDQIYAEAQRQGISRVALLERLLRNGLNER